MEINVYWLEMAHDFIFDTGTSIQGKDSCDGVVVAGDEEVSVCCCRYFVGQVLMRILRCFERYFLIIVYIHKNIFHCTHIYSI